MTRETYCGNLLWQSGLTLLALLASNTAPVMRIVRIPIYEQSQDGATTPTEAAEGATGGGRTGGGRRR